MDWIIEIDGVQSKWTTIKVFEQWGMLSRELFVEGFLVGVDKRAAVFRYFQLKAVLNIDWVENIFTFDLEGKLSSRAFEM